MNMTLFTGILIVLQIICFLAGKRASKNLQNQKDYFLAGKDVQFFPLLMTFVATQIGGGLVLGSAEEAYRFGWTVLFYPLGACLGFVLLAMGIGKKLAQFQVSTVAQLFEVVYQSRMLKQIASLLSILSLFMILVAQVIASKKFMVSLGFDQTAFFIAFWVVVVIYTVMGGLKAVVSIDIIQALFFMLIFSLGFGYVLYASDFSFASTLQSGMSGEAFEFNASKLSGWLLMPLLFMVIEQDMAQRCFAAQSPRVVTRAAACAAFCTLAICIIPVFLGVLGKQAGIEVPAGSSVFMDVAQALTTPALSAFLGCAVLMAIISTAISLLNAVSSNLTQDFDFSLVQKLRSVTGSRWMTAGIGVLAVGGSFYFGEIVDLLIQSYELSVCCLFVPVFAALFKAKGNTVSAGLAMAFGGMGFVLFRVWEVEFPREILSIFLSAAGYGLGEAWLSLKARSSEKAAMTCE
ncbi:sodium:solute symporter family protein [Candidatus Protochlamydia phocaeensis]|uniref:sodium:solute symporter family protein n=1 Tax=Candidatus Protochlamydia phocaeensis TaxID=1414722 RepID=UPI000837C9E2|nr:sodium:solute symporter family protein [Candidatus Protochlamydia phocaeensis]